MNEPMARWAGHWEIGGPEGIFINLVQAPWRLHRLTMRLCFGIKWVPYTAPLGVFDFVGTDDSWKEVL